MSAWERVSEEVRIISTPQVTDSSVYKWKKKTTTKSKQKRDDTNNSNLFLPEIVM